MRKNNTSFPAPSQAETISGFCWLAFQLILLPSMLHAANGIFSHGLSETELNFLFFLINFLAVVIIFHRFLAASFTQVLRHPAEFIQAVILGLCAYYACAWVTTWAVGKLQPGFVNVNDSSIAALSKGNWFLMATGTIVLAPPAEECFYRGLIFRNLYKQSHWVAYLVSMTVFALIHIIGYIGSASPLTLVLCFFQYLPAGLCLAWSYAKGETILSPIVIHALINARSIGVLRW